MPDNQKSEMVFRWWYDRSVKATRQFEGYTRSDLYSPLDGDDGVVKWHSIIHFRTPEDLNNWLKSSDRADLLEEGRGAFLAHRSKSFI